MILYFVLVGFVTGAAGAGLVLYTGGGVLLGLLAYSLTGALGVVLSAIIVTFAPTRTRRDMAARSHPVRAGTTLGARPVGARPIRSRHVRVGAQAPRR